MRHRCPEPRHRRGFTLIEMLVGVSLLAIVLALGVPSLQRFIVNSRLKAVNSQLVSDLAFARSEAASRNMPVFWTWRAIPFGASPGSCYTIFTATVVGAQCDCSLGAGAACPNAAAATEIRTVRILRSGSIDLQPAAGMALTFAFDNVNGGLFFGTTDMGDAVLADFVIDTSVRGDVSRTLRSSISPAGRTKVCTSGATPIAGYPAC